MPMFASQFDKLLAKATDESVTEPDWMAMMAMCDLVRQQEILPNAAIGAVRKCMFHRNSQVVLNALLVLECLVKNCGQPVHEEVTHYEFLEEIKEIARTGYYTVRLKVLSLIASWAAVFKGEPRYNAVKETYDALKAEGFQFPELNDSEALFDAARAPDWEDGRMCHLCRQQFSMTKRKHHCRNCGQIFCADCTADRIPLPHYGIEKEVRVCSICANKMKAGKDGEPAARLATGNPPLAGTSSGQQPAANPQVEAEQKAKELELKEKEELDLAIALSLSQQEAQPSPTLPVTRESAPAASNIYAEVERVPAAPAIPEPEVDPALAVYMDRQYWEGVRAGTVQPTTNGGIYPTMSQSPPPQAAVQQHVPQAAQQQASPQAAPQPPPGTDEDYAQQVKDLSEMLMRRLNMAAMKGQHVGTDPHIQTLLASLTALHPRLVTAIEDTERKMVAQQTLLTKIGTCKQARSSLTAMRAEHMAKVAQQQAEQQELMRMQMEQKLELMRQQKEEQLKYQEQLKKQHEQALKDREIAKQQYGASTSPLVPAQQYGTPSTVQSSNPIMSTHVNPTNYMPPQGQPPISYAQPYQHHQVPMGYVPPQYSQHSMQQMRPPQQMMSPPEQHGPPPQPMQHQYEPQPHPPQQQQMQPPQHMAPPQQHMPPQQMPPQQMPPQQMPPQQLPPQQMPPQQMQPMPPQQQMPPPQQMAPPQMQPQQPQMQPPSQMAPPRPSQQDMMSALSAAPAPPSDLPPPAQPASRREEPAVADLISF